MSRVAALFVALAAASAGALEGKWTPQQVLELEPAWLRKQGLQVPTKRLWDPKKGGGLLANAVNLGGCSASFVSPEGLVISNHHCVVDILQEHSRPGDDLFEKGYLARGRDHLHARHRDRAYGRACLRHYDLRTWTARWSAIRSRLFFAECAERGGRARCPSTSGSRPSASR